MSTGQRQHTPRPSTGRDWVLVEAMTDRPEFEYYVVYESEARESVIVDLRFPHTPGSHRNRANAEFIVRACNSHDELLEVLGRCVDFMSSVAGTEVVSETFILALRDAQAAIAKAEGSSDAKTR